jgi:NAD(P)-dependent dehydrogenase (short-subunit alcohol dehydrogenase family)
MAGFGIVTGGARGIGLATVRGLLAQGVCDEVAVIDTRTGELISRIADVGEGPWGAHMVGAFNYCH